MVTNTNRFSREYANQVADALNNPQATGQGVNITTTNGTIIVSKENSLNTLQNTDNPKLFSFKSGPAKRYSHKDAEGNEYPSLYVFLGNTSNYSYQNIHIENQWLSQGAKINGICFINGKKKPQLTTIDNESGNEINFTTKGILDSVLNVDSIDGWVELPCATIEASNLYLGCFLGPPAVPYLFLGIFDTTIIEGANNSNDKIYANQPNFEWFNNTKNGVFVGFIGEPKKIIDLKIYSSDDLSSSIDFDTGEISDFSKYRYQLIDNNTSIEFVDTTTNVGLYSVSPIFLGGALSSTNNFPNYAFYLTSKEVALNSEHGNYDRYREVVPVLSSDSYVIYSIANNYPQSNSDRIFIKCSLSASNNIARHIYLDGNSAMTNVGVPYGLLFIPDYSRFSIINDTDVLALTFYDAMVEGIDGIVWEPGFEIYNPNNSSYSSTQDFGYLGYLASKPLGCAILPGIAHYSQYEYFGFKGLSKSNYGSYLRKYGQLCPAYINTDLLNELTQKFESVDSSIRKQWVSDDAIKYGGKMPGTFGSLQNQQTRNDERFNIHLPGSTNRKLQAQIQYLGLYDFQKDEHLSVTLGSYQPFSDLDKKTHLRSKYDWVVRSYEGVNEMGEESMISADGANIAYIKAFKPDTAYLDDVKSSYDDSVTALPNSLKLIGMARQPDLLTLRNFEIPWEDYITQIGLSNFITDYESVEAQDKSVINHILVKSYDNNTGQTYLRYTDLNFKEIVDGLTDLSDAIGPSGQLSGLSALYDLVDTLSDLVGSISSDYWVLGANETSAYGQAIGNSSASKVIDLNDRELVDGWKATSELSAEDGLYVNGGRFFVNNVMDSIIKDCGLILDGGSLNIKQGSDPLIIGEYIYNRNMLFITQNGHQEGIGILTDTRSDLSIDIPDTSEISSKLSSLQDELNDLNDKTNELTGNIRNLNGQIGSLSGEVNTLKNSNNQLTSDIHKLSDDLSTSTTNLQSQIVTLGTQTQEHINELTASVYTLQNELSTSSTEIYRLQNEISSTNNRVYALQEELSTVRDNTRALQNELSSTNTQIYRLSDELSTTRGNVYALSNEVNLLETVITNIGNAVTVVDNNFYALSNEVKTTNNAVYNLSNSINSIDTTIYTLSNQTSSIILSVSTLSDDVLSAQEQIITLHNQVSTVSNTVGSLATQVNTNTTNIGNNTARIASLQNSLSNYVTLNTSQTISAEKFFHNSSDDSGITINGKDDGTATIYIHSSDDSNWTQQDYYGFYVSDPTLGAGGKYTAYEDTQIRIGTVDEEGGVVLKFPSKAGTFLTDSDINLTTLSSTLSSIQTNISDIRSDNSDLRLSVVANATNISAISNDIGNIGSILDFINGEII